MPDLRHPDDEVASVATALDAAGSQVYDVVLCDVHLDGESGIDLFCRVSVSWPDPLDSFVLLTGDVLAPDVARFLDEFHCAHLSKPFAVDEVARVLRRAAHREHRAA